MLVHVRCQVQSLTSSYGRKHFSSSPLNSQKIIFPKPTKMNTKSQPKSKRPTCPNCSKPLSICLCSRIKCPGLDNQVHVTILQHSLEKKHPLNSTNIAKLGLKNLTVVTVCDVNFEARFDIRLLHSGHQGERLESTPYVCKNASERLSSDGDLNCRAGEKRNEYLGKLGSHDSLECLYVDGNNGISGNHGGVWTSKEHNGPNCFSISIEKYGKISSLSHGMVKYNYRSSKFEEIMTSPLAEEVMAKGLLVKKFRKSKEGERMELEEFEIPVPPGTVVLFPAQNSVAIEDVAISVKNLIVLDGTWAKANRIYNENPWLRFLPCVRLDIDKVSLYSEVRHQPKPGCLSTLESIVYALGTFGEKNILEGLNNLLEVFESMVEDQRRCKNQRMGKTSFFSSKSLI